MLLRAVFTKKCPHYKAVWALRESIIGMNGKKEYSTKHLSRLIVWQVIKVAANYFGTTLMPSDFEGDVDEIVWPALELQIVARDLSALRMGSLEVLDFPTE